MKHSAKRDMSICRFRKSEGLPCRRCEFSDRCKEYQTYKRTGFQPNWNKTPPVTKPKHWKWTEEDDKIVLDDSLTIAEMAAMLNRTVGAIWMRRHKLRSEKE